jgi:hypothetical protein
VATPRGAAFDVVAILATRGAVQVVLTVAVEPPSPLVVQMESAEQRLAVRLAGHSDLRVLRDEVSSGVADPTRFLPRRIGIAEEGAVATRFIGRR